MADKIDVDVTGKSKYEVAQEMTRTILWTIERKEHFQGVTRQEYLTTVLQCVTALNGVNPF
jgi:hypothetical protein